MNGLSSTVLIVPGLRGHVPDHWQTLLEHRLPNARSVPPLERDGLSCAARMEALDAALRRIAGPVILVAHSAGVMTTVHWARLHRREIKGALLAAPADLETPLPDGYPQPDALRRARLDADSAQAAAVSEHRRREHERSARAHRARGRARRCMGQPARRSRRGRPSESRIGLWRVAGRARVDRRARRRAAARRAMRRSAMNAGACHRSRDRPRSCCTRCCDHSALKLRGRNGQTRRDARGCRERRGGAQFVGSGHGRCKAIVVYGCASRLSALGSRLKAHGSRLTACDLRLQQRSTPFHTQRTYRPIAPEPIGIARRARFRQAACPLRPAPPPHITTAHATCDTARNPPAPPPLRHAPLAPRPLPLAPRPSRRSIGCADGISPKSRFFIRERRT
ncbi:alpha/beta fold family hydrolase [Burkholderia mallei]|nr:serine hydrolase family protein [Burkholderia mallei]SUX34556.1 alpha/beta fold family hydrolase [Burkholderia mallei]